MISQYLFNLLVQTRYPKEHAEPLDAERGVGAADNGFPRL